MSSITTPNPDDHAASGYRTAESRPGPADPPHPDPRLITTTDELLAEVLKRPGQTFFARKRLLPIGVGEYTVIGFADGTEVQVLSA